MRIKARFAKATIVPGKPVQLIFDVNSEEMRSQLEGLMEMDEDSKVMLDIQLAEPPKPKQTTIFER